MRPITSELAAYAANASWEALPERVRAEAGRAFLNWFGCAVGGSGEDVVNAAHAATALTRGAAQASILGRGAKSDTVSAAFLNCLSSSALAFDDTHLATVTHPTGPVAAALLAYAETTPINGTHFLTAVALGIEVHCRMSNVLLMPPASANLSLYITGVTGPIGAAAAVGRAMGLDERRMHWAIGHAATQGAGFRATHGAMSGLVVPAYAARAGLFAAHLAASGVECAENVLEAPKGFVEVYAPGADLNRAADGLGDHHEMCANAYKPYPSGIVVHPAIDACREIAGQVVDPGAVRAVRLYVHPLTMQLANRPQPRDMFEAQVSISHWAAAVFVRGAAGIAEVRSDAIHDPAMADFRSRVTGVSDETLARDQARVEVDLADGSTLMASIEHARGSIDRPMSDDELDQKFEAQCEMVFDRHHAEHLLALMRTIATQADVGAAVARTIGEGGCRRRPANHQEN